MKSRLSGREWAGVYAALGVILFLLSLLHLQLGFDHSAVYHQLIFGVLITIISAGLVVGAVWHYRQPFPVEMYRRINGWILGGGVTISALGLVSLYVGSNVVTPAELLESIHLMGSMGLTLGFVFGSLEAGVIETADTAARAETLETERERLEILNDLLRHYVLNGVSVIGGHADFLEAETTGEKRDSARTIAHRSRRIGHLVERISILTKTQWMQEEDIRADLETTLHEAVSSKCNVDTTVEIDADIPHVIANVGFEDGIDLLVEGITSMIDSDGTVSIRHEPDAEAITVTVRPVDIPPNLRDELLQPVASNIGLELYLAKKILEPAIELDVTEPSEQVLTFTLQAALVE